MIIYVISSPDDNFLTLTGNRELAMNARKAAQVTGDKIEMQSWDTDKSPLCSISLNIQVIDDMSKEPNEPLHQPR
jgi:uncharacterized protein (UPF0147 family)